MTASEPRHQYHLSLAAQGPSTQDPGKPVIGDDGVIEIAVPRDRQGSFKPQIVAKGQTRLDGFDDRIISLYARGLSVREIQTHRQVLYGSRSRPT